MTTYSFVEIVHRLDSGAHPPLHYMMWKVWQKAVGSSPFALRVLSILIAGLTVPVLVSMSSSATPGAQEQLSVRRLLLSDIGSWYVYLPALLAACHLSSVAAGSTARMYSLGILLAGITALSLLKAIRCDVQCSPWWLVYGVTVAAFCYTHYFAFFSILGQVLFVAVICVIRLKDRNWIGFIAVLKGAIAAGTIGLLLYMPWFRVFLSQAKDVHDGWGVPSVTFAELERVFLHWVSGADYPASIESRIWLCWIAFIAAWTLWKGQLSALFFLMQAVVPWLCVICLAGLTDRSGLLERYFVFANVGLFGFWSVTWRVLPNASTRLVFLALLISPCLLGLFDRLNNVVSAQSAFVQCMTWLRENYQAEDLFLLDNYREINRFRYYSFQAGLPWLDVRARLHPFQRGHVAHLASLSSDDIYLLAENVGPKSANARTWKVVIRYFRVSNVRENVVGVARRFEGNDGLTIDLNER